MLFLQFELSVQQNVRTLLPLTTQSTHMKKRIILSYGFHFYIIFIFQDPQNNGIFQWKNVTSFRNITQLSFQLISEPMFGDYSIAVERTSGKTLMHQFTVNRYGIRYLEFFYTNEGFKGPNKVTFMLELGIVGEGGFGVLPSSFLGLSCVVIFLAAHFLPVSCFWPLPFLPKIYLILQNLLSLPGKV